MSWGVRRLHTPEEFIDPSAQFRLGDVFGANSVDASIVRLVVACRQLEALRRALRALQREAPDGLQEGLHFGFLCLIGAAKEAADAFRDCDAQDAFGWLDQAESKLDDLKAALSFLRSACDKSDPTSVYSRLLSPLRHHSAFHFNRAKVEASLRAMEEDRFKIAETDDAGHVHGIPMALAVLAHTGWLAVTGSEDVSSAIDEVDAVRKAIIEVGQDLYFAHARLATEPPDRAV